MMDTGFFKGCNGLSWKGGKVGMDINTVIKGLEACVDRVPGEYTCDKCPYETHGNDCEIDLTRDAIALLKEQQELMFGMIVNSNAKCTDLGIHFRRLVLCKDCVRYEQETGRCKNKVVHGNAETWFCADGERR